MQQTDVKFQLQQQKDAKSITDLHKNFLTMSQQLLIQANPATTGTITLNCNELESINSHGICLLIKLILYSQWQHKRLQVFGLSEYNQYIFEITRLNEFIDIVGSKIQAEAVVHAT